ncbi:MAG: DUF4328 domain-containing protein [Candidatus Dormibacteraeota bacterium]|nr:DUF4328 domain-containing protein [Candidatus Dormibacteraeota bacterium]
MSTASLTQSGLAQRGTRWAEQFWQYAKKHREAWPAVAIIVATLIAYHFTLASMFDFLRLDTPLAYLPLLPLFCVGIAVVTAKRFEHAPRPIQDRQIDFLVGIPMVVVALLFITLAPIIASTYYWTDRADVLSLALFAAGATIIGYGITWFWRLKASFIFLVLMWPALYLHLLPSVMQKFADYTNAALAQIVHVLPLGVTLGGQAGLLIVNQAHAAPLQISVGTACSGANSVLGFALIGGAILSTLGGGKGRKLLWWIAGMTLAFIFNIVRLVSILALASWGHPGLALGGYHAVIGLILFAIVVMVMLFALPWFGLHTKDPVTMGEGVTRAARKVKTDTTPVFGTTSLLEQHLAERAVAESVARTNEPSTEAPSDAGQPDIPQQPAGAPPSPPVIPAVLSTIYRPARGTAKFAAFNFGFAAFMAVLFGIANVTRLGIAGAISGGHTPSVDSASGSDTFVTATGFFMYLFLAVGGVSVLVWLWRIVTNNSVLGATETRFSPNKAVGVWLIPFVNLVLAPRTLIEAWRAAEPSAAVSTESSRSTIKQPRLIVVWWVTFAIGLLLTIFISGAATGVGASLAGALRWSAILGIVASVFRIVAAVLAIRLLLSLTKRQEQRASLRRVEMAKSAMATTSGAAAPASSSLLAQLTNQAKRPWTLQRKLATGAVLVLTAIVALADQGLQPYAAFNDGSGSPTVKPFGPSSAPSGWEIYQIAEYPWATQYFGDNSTWYRYTVTRPGTGAVAYADVILTDDKGSLDTYNLQNCFLFHDYDIRTSEKIDLGNGVYGLLLNYTDPATNTKWGTVSWAWPVEYKNDTYYERIALTSSPLQGAPSDAPSFQPAGGLQDIFLDLLNGVSGGHNDPSAAPLYENVDNALEGTATVLVRHTVTGKTS